jgi:hypothetical protein
VPGPYNGTVYPYGLHPLAASPAPLPAGEPSSSDALAALLANPAIWRGRDCAPEPAAVPTGFADLDAVLPGGGWPQGALTEILLAREGIGEIRLALPALARLQSQGQDVAWIDPPFQPYAPALAAAGLDLSRLLIVRCRDRRDAPWAYEQALRSVECGAAFAWLPLQDERLLRRLSVAAREGCTWGVLWRRPGDHARTSAAPLRLGLAPSGGRLAVHVLKRRGGELREPVLIRHQASENRDQPRFDAFAGAPGAGFGPAFHERNAVAASAAPRRLASG